MKTKDITDIIPAKSMKLSYRNTDIFFSALDGLNIYENIVKNKFDEDVKVINRISSPNYVSINLYGTSVDMDLIDYITDELSSIKYISKIVFVGLDRKVKKMMKRKMKDENTNFIYSFIDDYEKSKEWLVS